MSAKHFPAPKKSRQRALDGRANNQPPEHTRFQPGLSGNPKGRPKGSFSSAAMLRKILNETVELRENDRLRKMSKFEAMHHSLVHKALKGEPRALKTMMEIVEDDAAFLPPPPPITLVFGIKEEHQKLVALQIAQEKERKEFAALKTAYERKHPEFLAWKTAQQKNKPGPPDEDTSR